MNASGVSLANVAGRILDRLRGRSFVHVSGTSRGDDLPNRCNRFDRPGTAGIACQAELHCSRIIDLLVFKTFTCGNCASMRGR